MNIDIIRHWIPDLKQTKNKNCYVAKQCPFCPKIPRSKSFRVNLKLKVWKCYQCGRYGKNENKFINYRKRLNKNYNLIYSTKILKKIGRNPPASELTKRGISIEVYYGCDSYQDSNLPF